MCKTIGFLMLTLSGWAGLAMATQIGPDDFGGNEFVETYSDLGYPHGTQLPSVFTLNSITYTNFSANLRYENFHDCYDGWCLVPESTGTSTWLLAFESPINRIGVYASTNNDISADAFLSIFDVEGNRLGYDAYGEEVLGSPFVTRFYGVESLDIPIATATLGLTSRVRITFDNLTTEIVSSQEVPTPATILLISIDPAHQ